MTTIKQQVLMGQTDESLAQTTAGKQELQGQPWREPCRVLLKEDREVVETKIYHMLVKGKGVCCAA